MKKGGGMSTNKKEAELLERVKAPTPKFFKKVRTIGLTLGAVGAALLAAPVALPPLVVTLAGYLVTAGLVAGAVSATAKEEGGK